MPYFIVQSACFAISIQTITSV